MHKRDLRSWLAVARRRRSLLLATPFLFAVALGLVSAVRTPQYRATADVLVEPDQAATGADDIERFQAAQRDIVESEEVAAAAADALGGLSPDEVRTATSAATSSDSDVLRVAATSVDPVQARDLANTVAAAYVQNRRLDALEDRQRVADELARQLDAALQQVAEYDRRIVAAGGTPGASGEVTAPEGPPLQGPAEPGLGGPTPPGLDPGTAPPTDDEGTKAARYAALVQYQELYRQLEAVRLEISLTEGPAQVLEQAGVPGAPFNNDTGRNIAIGLVVGLAFGVAAALGREQLDDRVHTVDDARAATGLAVLAELPHDRGTLGRDRVATADGHGSFPEAVRALRTSIALLGIDEPVRRILVTSPSPGDGKSTLAANLAVAFAGTGATTVLVSADLRRPTVERLLGLTADRGITTILGGLDAAGARPASLAGSGPERDGARALALALDDALLPTRVANLKVLPAGPRPPSPAELLGSRRMADALDGLAERADVLVIDTPPVLAATDAVVLAPQADGILMLATVGQTSRQALRQAREMLGGPAVRLLGLVANRVDRHEGYGDAYPYVGLDDAPDRGGQASGTTAPVAPAASRS